MTGDLDPNVARALVDVGRLFGFRLEHAQRTAVIRARDAGATWAQLAPVMGMRARSNAREWATRHDNLAEARAESVAPVDDFGVSAGEVDARMAPGALTLWRSSYGGTVQDDLDQLTADVTQLACAIGLDADLRFSLVVCPTHRVFLNGRHRLAAALQRRLPTVPVVHRCYGSCVSDGAVDPVPVDPVG